MQQYALSLSSQTLVSSPWSWAFHPCPRSEDADTQIRIREIAEELLATLPSSSVAPRSDSPQTEVTHLSCSEDEEEEGGTEAAAETTAARAATEETTETNVARAATETMVARAGRGQKVGSYKKTKRNLCLKTRKSKL